jgi:hypothetical protein
MSSNSPPSPPTEENPLLKKPKPDKINLVKLLFKTTIPEKYPDTYLFEPHMVTNDGKETTASRNNSDYDTDWRTGLISSSNASQVKLASFLKLFVRVPSNVRLKKDIVKLEDFAPLNKKTDKKKLISYFFDDDLYEKMIKKYKEKSAVKNNHEDNIDFEKETDIVLDNLKIILKYVLFPNDSILYLEGKTYKLQALDISMSQIKYPPFNGLKNIEGYIDDNPIYEGRLEGEDVVYENKDDKDVQKEEYEEYVKQEKERIEELTKEVKVFEQDQRMRMPSYYHHPIQIPIQQHGGEGPITTSPPDSDGTKKKNKKKASKQKVIKEKGPKLNREQILFNYYPNPNDYKKRSRDQIKLQNEKFVQKIKELYEIGQVTILLNIFEVSPEGSDSNKDYNCNYHFSYAKTLLQKLLPKYNFEEIKKGKNRVKRLKFIKAAEIEDKNQKKKDAEDETNKQPEINFRGGQTLKRCKKLRKKTLRKRLR